jgi:hypothetical protein
MKMRTLLFSICLLDVVRAEDAVVADAPREFIRVEEAATATELQTSVVCLKKGKASVELVGAIHIADKKYYEALGKRFESYDALLYEGIGGDDEPAEDVAKEPLKKIDAAVPEKGKLNGLHAAYESGAEWLGLSYQMKEIDYEKANFVHADLSFAEFSELQKKRGESLLGFMIKTALQQQEMPKAREPNSLKMLISLVRGDKNGLKRELVHTLGEGDDQVAGLAGENVIVGDRNAKCLEVLDREVLGGKKKLGIFYGAAHFPDMVKRLETAGWKVKNTEWMVAWQIDK